MNSGKNQYSHLIHGTPILDTTPIEEDSSLVKAAENEIVRIGDLVIAASRTVKTLSYDLELKQRVKSFRENRIEDRKAGIQRREEDMEFIRVENHDLLEQHNEKQEMMADLLNKYETAVAQLSEIGLEINAAGPPRISSNINVVDSSSDVLFLASTIDTLSENISSGRKKARETRIECARLVVDEVRLKNEILEASLESDRLNAYLERLDERYEAAGREKAEPYDPTSFTESVIAQIERTSDDTERRLNRSRVDAVEYALQREYNDYVSLQEENTGRAKELARREGKLRDGKVTQEQTMIQVHRMEERISPSKKSGTDTLPSSPVTQGSRTPRTPRQSPKIKALADTHKARCNLALEELRQMVEENETSREAEFVASDKKHARIMELMRDIDAIVRYKASISSVEDEIEQLVRVGREVDDKLLQCRRANNIKDYSENEVKERKSETIADDTAKRSAIAALRREVKDLEEQVHRRESEQNALDLEISEVKASVETSVTDIVETSRRITRGPM